MFENLSSRIRRRGFLAGAAVFATLLAGCAENAPQDTFEPAGPNARKIDGLQRELFYISGIVGIIVLAAVAYAVWKFKDRGQDIPEQTHGNPKLEILLTILPAIILVVVAVPTVSAVFELDKKDNDCIINVTGQQWWWEYDYSGTCGGVEITEPIVTSGELVIPAGTPVLLRITSRDVIHSFWIPRLNGKRDAVPGRLHTLRLEADQPGMYTGQCTEFCGLSHARMRQAAVALTPADFQTWVNNQLEPYSANAPEAGTTAAVGEETFIAQCSRCHQVDDLTTAGKDDAGNDITVPVLAEPDRYVVSGSAPNLTNLMTRTAFAGWTFDLLTEECRDRLWNAPPDEFGALYLQGVTPECFDETNLREWLRNPPAMKPMYTDPNNLAASDGKTRGMPNLNLTQDQIDQLVAYLLERK
ncbi:MAG: cytochrome c oxidase subunit II [Actinomycetota bacterium]|nr:cytochrome c oxidase subunit II [Actinomycetota bacterium]